LNSIDRVIPVAIPEARPKKRPRPRIPKTMEYVTARVSSRKGPVLSTQQVVGKIEATEHIKACTRDADGRDCVVVHQAIRLTPL
jgi:hypothetical protein